MKNTNIFYVYEHWRTDKNECFYVGKGHGRRANDMKTARNRYHKAITAKLSREGYAVEVKIVAQNLTEKKAFSVEIERIAFWKADGADLANILPGGLGGPTWEGRKHSEDTKKKMSVAAKGNKGNLGRTFSEEHRKKLGDAQRGNSKSKGAIRSQEFKDSVSKRMKGNVFSVGKQASIETKKKMSEFKKEWWAKNKQAASDRMKLWWAEKKKVKTDGVC